MNKKIIIVGAFHEIIELAESNGVEIFGLIDSYKKGSYRGYKIIGTDEDAKSLDKNLLLIITPDKPEIRSKLVDYYSNLGFSFAKLISKTSVISKSSKIQDGTIVQVGVNISAECIIGRFVKLNTFCNIMHNSVIGDFTTIAPNAVILGNVEVGAYCYIGSNSTILPNLKVSENAIVGAGAVVTNDVPPFTIVAGNPAKILKQFNNADEIRNYFRSKQKLK